MTPPPPLEVGHLLAAALDHAPEDRDAFLDVACGDNVAVRAELRLLLAAHEAAPTGFLDSPAVAGDLEATIKLEARALPTPSMQVDAITEQPGERIGRYKLLQIIGQGGFGTVWMAEQVEPVTRRVALKIIKLGMDTKEVIARFEVERQALAMMDHQNIARVLDAGATDKGRPYFVMELVKGMPITQYCDQTQLGTRERLALFGDVCSAINHAHQKGVIHRDIKPSNVMITLHGDKPVVKVIDFGIAKATQGKLTDKTLFTRFEQFVGTPVYMSPEQAVMSGLDIDTRSDIYALGILLYELLVGKPPFDSKSLLSAGYDEMRRIIREVEPVKPSSHLSTILGEERTLLAKARDIEPAKLDRLVEPDLDWIVMKAIDKDRTRRYETANAFARDIAHFLADEPVSASPPSAVYQFRKFARRNKAALHVASAIATVLVAATLVSTWLAVRATRAEKKMAAERDAKELARRDAEDIATFLGNVFQSPDPARDGRTITVAETLDTAAKKLDTDLATQPAQRAKLQATLGKTYFALGLARQAIPLQEKARDYYLATFGPEHLDTIKVMNDLAGSYEDVGRQDEALKLREEVLRLTRKVLGSEKPGTLSAMGNLAFAYYDSGRRDEALQMQEEVLKLSRKVNGPEDPSTLSAMHNLAISYDYAARRDDALRMKEELLILRRKVHGPEHPDTIKAMANLANSYDDVGREDEALKLREEVMSLSRRVSGPEHPATFSAMHNLSNSYTAVGRKDEALKMREELLALRRKVLGPEHPETLSAMSLLASSYGDAGRWDETLKMREETVTLSRKVLGSEHPDTLLAMGNLAASYSNLGRWEESLKLREEILRHTLKNVGLEHPGTLSAMSSLATSCWEVGRRDEAIKLREDTLTLRRKVNGPEHADTLIEMRHLASSYRANGDLAKAEALDNEIAAAHVKQFWGDLATDDRVTRLYEAGLKPGSFQPQPDGTWSVDLTILKDFNDLALFQGKRITRLNLRNTSVSDLAPLRGFPLKLLNLEKTKVTDLTPLRGMPLEELTLNFLAISDLSILRGLPLKKLELSGTPVASLEPLRGMALKRLALASARVIDLQPLKGMPLEYLNLVNTAVTDLSVLRGMPLTNARFAGCKQVTDLTPLAEARDLTLLTLPPNAKDIEFLRTFPKLERLSFNPAKSQTFLPSQTAAEFWTAYDAAKVPSRQP